MTDVRMQMAALRRPRLLIRAARFGLADYRRERHLRRLLSAPALPAPANALPMLIAAEERIEETRRSGDAGYNIARHIDVLIALMGEARMLPPSPV